MTDIICPIDISDLFGLMLRGEFRRMTDMDLEGFAGVEGQGWICDDANVDGAHGEYVVIADHGPEGITFNVVDAEHGTTWVAEAGRDLELEQIGG